MGDFRLIFPSVRKKMGGKRFAGLKKKIDWTRGENSQCGNGICQTEKKMNWTKGENSQCSKGIYRTEKEN